MNRSSLSLLLAVFSACATPEYVTEISFYGAVDVERNRAASQAAQNLPWGGDYPVKVIQGLLPEGLELTDGGGKLVVKDGYEERYEVLGDVVSTHGDDPTFASFYWYADMHDMHSRGRDRYCKAQAPFRLLTLGIWSAFVPLNWPCFIQYSRDRDTNVAIHVQELRRAVHAMGGNLAVIASIGNVRHTGVVVQSSSHVATASTYQVDVRAESVKAFALKDSSPWLQ